MAKRFYPSAAARLVDRYVERHNKRDPQTAELVADENTRLRKLKLATRLRRAYRLLLLALMLLVLAAAVMLRTWTPRARFRIDPGPVVAFKFHRQTSEQIRCAATLLPRGLKRRTSADAPLNATHL